VAAKQAILALVSTDRMMVDLEDLVHSLDLCQGCYNLTRYLPFVN
jgi:hypothetical protein